MCAWSDPAFVWYLTCICKQFVIIRRCIQVILNCHCSLSLSFLSFIPQMFSLVLLSISSQQCAFVSYLFYISKNFLLSNKKASINHLLITSVEVKTRNWSYLCFDHL